MSLMKSPEDRDEGDNTAEHTANSKNSYSLFFPKFSHSMSIDTSSLG